MMRNMRRGVPKLFKDGTENLSGLQAAVLRNLQACKALWEITRTSFGPNGMNKLIINHIDKVFVTNDAATIMNEMEVEHPAAKLIVLAAKMQEQEIGDGSNYVVCLAGALLSKAEALVKMGLHPSEIVNGYLIAGKKVMELLPTLVVDTIEEKDMRNKKMLIKGMYAAISSKQYGRQKELSNLIGEACLIAMPDNTYNFNVDNVRVAKIMGGNIGQSHCVKGMVIQKAPKSTVQIVEQAQIGIFTCSIQCSDTETKGTALLHSAEELENFNLSEEKEISKTILAIKESGVNVIVTGGTIDDMALHFLEKYELMVVKLTSKWELRRLCRAVGARALVSLGPVEKEHQGTCDRVYVREYGLKRVTIFEQADQNDTQVSTVVLRASTQNTLNDLEKAVDDGVNCVKAMCKNKPAKFLAGAGASDIELARLLKDFGAKSTGLEQYSIKKFAEALEVVPMTLAENAGLKAINILSQLYAAHEKGLTNVGVDIEAEGRTVELNPPVTPGVRPQRPQRKQKSPTSVGVRDCVGIGILDLLCTKQQAIKLALDVAVTILRVDQVVRAKRAGGPKMRKQGHWDDTD